MIGGDIRSDVAFEGDGYLELHRSLLPHKIEDEPEVIAMVLQTNSSDGLIFWHGQPESVDGSGQDFMSLSSKYAQRILYRTLIH